MLLLAVLAIGIETYQLFAHAHCDVGLEVPKSHRSSRGFGTAILVDALSSAVACLYLFLVGDRWWLLLLPIAGHLFYGSVFAWVRGFYMTVHDYRLPTIYADNSYRRLKRTLTTIDAAFHLLAVVLLVPHVPGLVALTAATAGALSFVAVFSPSAVALVRRVRSHGR